jgi:hypothetical protein
VAARVDTGLVKALLAEGPRVDNAALEAAVQQQAVHGGSLDTLLLEAGVVDEETLVRALSTTNLTDAVSLGRFVAPDPEAVAKLPRRMAIAMGLTPLHVDDDGALHVGCRSPLDQDLIAEVAGLLQRAIVAHVVPEVRLRQGLQAAYDHPLEERFVALLRRLDAHHEAPTLPPPTAGDGVEPTVTWDLAEALAHLAAQESRDGIAGVVLAFARRFLPFAAVIGVRDGYAVGWMRQGACEGLQFVQPLAIPRQSFLAGAIEAASPSLVSPEPVADNDAVFGWLGRRRPKTVLTVPIVVARRPIGALVADGGLRHRAPNEVAELTAFAARLGPAFEVLLRHRQTSALPAPPPLAVARGAATLDPTAATMLRPGTLELDELPAPPPLMLMPAVGEPLGMPIVESGSMPDDDARERLFSLPDGSAPAAWRGALEATVEQGLQGGTVEDEQDWEAVVYDPLPAMTATTTTANPATTATAATMTTPATRAAERPTHDVDLPALSSHVLQDLYDPGRKTPPSPPPPETIPPLPALPTMSHAELVELLFAGDETLVERAARELVHRGRATVSALEARFPGRLRVDPFDPGENVRNAARLGPLIDVLAQLGRDGLEGAVLYVESRYPAHRFAAVLLFTLTPDVRAIDLLRSRLHDAEPRIQRLATEALLPFLAHPRFESLLVHLRERAHGATRSYPLETRRRATELLGEFRDVSAVPLLMGLLSSPDMQESAARALRAITLVDHGTRAKGWEKWWQRARKRSRIDWLIDGLAAEALELRLAAWRELTTLVGDDFGYRPEADKRARQRALTVWQQWWLDEQQLQRRSPAGDVDADANVAASVKGPAR